MTRILSPLAISVLMIAATHVLAAPNDAQDVKNVVLGFATAWNHHDMVAFGKLFAPDADFVNVAGVRWKGRKEIQMAHAWAHGAIPRDTAGFEKSDPHYGIFKASTLRFTRLDVRFLRKDVAVAVANSELVGDTRTPNARHTVLTIVLTGRNGEWLIAAAQNTEIARTVK